MHMKNLSNRLDIAMRIKFWEKFYRREGNQVYDGVCKDMFFSILNLLPKITIGK